MYVLEIFRKKRIFSPIYKTVWPVISARIAYPPGTEDEPEQRLVYFGALAYAVAYRSALAAGMSTSAAHYMARMLLRNYKLEDWINEAVIAVFAPEDEEARVYAEGFLERAGSMVEAVRSEKDAADIGPAMADLAGFYRKAAFEGR